MEKVKNKYQSPKYFVQLNQIWSPFSILYNFKLIGLSVWRILIAQCTSSMINGHTSALPSTHRSLTWINFWHFLRELSKTTTPWAENHFATKPLAENCRIFFQKNRSKWAKIGVFWPKKSCFLADFFLNGIGGGTHPPYPLTESHCDQKPLKERGGTPPP